MFSDGTPLTIRDVLFNLYMYLDPVFSGSATLYSVNIKGLEEYRTQSGNAADQEGLEDTIRVRAEQAISDIIAWCDDSARAPFCPHGDAAGLYRPRQRVFPGRNEFGLDGGGNLCGRRAQRL